MQTLQSEMKCRYRLRWRSTGHCAGGFDDSTFWWRSGSDGGIQMNNEGKNKAGKIRGWQRCVLLLLVLGMMSSSLMPQLDFAGLHTGTVEAQAATVYERFYFQGGLLMPPKTSLSYPWTYMRKGDKVQFAVNSNGTVYVGLTRKSDQKMIGVERSNNFTVTFTVPSTGYYRVFIVNNSKKTVSLSGVAVCSR